MSEGEHRATTPGPSLTFV